jgi:hypothetical protein
MSQLRWAALKTRRNKPDHDPKDDELQAEGDREPVCAFASIVLKGLLNDDGNLRREK